LRRRGLNNVARFSWEDSARRVSHQIDILRPFVSGPSPIESTVPESSSSKL